MNEKDTKKRREWVKNAAIIFLTVMLILTFFSNTIMNYSLPEVATQYVQKGTITAKVRGTGNVEATDPYNVMVKETRVISAVAVKQGDAVEKDQVIYYLEDAESDELKKAEDELEELQLAYMKGLFGNNVSSEVISKVASGNTDGFSALQTKVTDMQNRLEAAKERVKECQDNLDALSLQSTVNTNNSTVNTIPEENEVSNATTKLEDAQTQETNAQAAFEREKADKITSLTNQIAEKEKQIADLQTLVDKAESVAGSISGSVNPTPSPAVMTTSGGIDTYISQREAAKQVVDDKLKAIINAIKASDNTFSGTTINDAKTWIDNNNKYQDYQIMLQDYDAAVSQYNIAVEQVNNISNQLNNYENNENALNARKNELAELKATLEKVNAVTYEKGESVKNAQNKLIQAEQNLSDKTNANKQTSVAYQNQIANAEAALKTAQAVYDLLKEEQTVMLSDINAELDLAKASKDIAEKEEEIAKLKEKSMGAAIKAPVAGTIVSLTYVAGETTKPEETAAVIQVDGKGFTLTISVTNDQAKKVQVGDVAELQNSWYYEDAQVILSAIKADPDNPGQKKLLVFNVTGASIQNGQALSVSVGQRSSEYEFVVPNSAMREDNNGKFILIVESKSSPLGNRYIATRVDVEVLASDDNNTAISAPLYGYEYVITTSTKPVEAGKQVRLNE